jgi:hypothetical protein
MSRFLHGARTTADKVSLAIKMLPGGEREVSGSTSAENTGI